MSNANEREDAIEAWIEAEVAEAVKPYEAVLPPAALELLRVEVDLFLRAHPEMVRLRQVVEPRIVEESGTVGPAAEETPRAARGPGKR